MKLGIHETIFPIIARNISDSEEFSSHRKLVQQLLQDNRSTMEVLYKVKNCRKVTIEEYADKLVAWFSQRWTEADPKWSQLFEKFERTEIDGCYAYRKRA